MQSHNYLPSLSTGIYGAYALKPVNNHEDEKEANEPKEEYEQKEDLQYQQQLREKFFRENSDSDVPIRPIYEAAKEIIDKQQLVFKPECNYKGCCNKPEISQSALKGDMYICKKHRIEMAHKLQKSCGDNQWVNQAVSKLQTCDDHEFHRDGVQYAQQDYFLQNYSKIQQLKLKVAKKLSTINDRMSAEYWEYVLHWIQLEKQAKALLSIKMVSNPLFVILIILPVLFASSLIDDCMEDTAQDEARMQREKERREAIQKCDAAFDVLNDEFIQNKNLKDKCIKRIKEIDGELKEIETNYRNEIQPILDKLNVTVENIFDIDVEKIKQEKKASSPAEILQLVQTLNELQAKQNAFAKSEAAAKRKALEMERKRKERERRQREREEDELNWKRAINRAESGCRNTPNGKRAVYFVYDRRNFFSSGYRDGYSVYTDETWDSYGNYRICKMVGNKGSISTDFRFRYSGRWTFWVRHYDGFTKSVGDIININVR